MKSENNLLLVKKRKCWKSHIMKNAGVGIFILERETITEKDSWFYTWGKEVSV